MSGSQSSDAAAVVSKSLTAIHGRFSTGDVLSPLLAGVRSSLSALEAVGTAGMGTPKGPQDLTHARLDLGRRQRPPYSHE